ncbi:class I SAM-dependent methyltransferase [Lysobacter sp. CFH 32150]|uniref:class I SAM-dependent methyltransferase n=1 Tax=Lysobacter sp. CFH 32150 TaxID=2927128 RepID=UPI001FA7E7D3|nr:class I SAM-dependent methyltransferase [Lysobacter sp. CFH 32150]MCI4568894.1 class I SAM-dependent methyltransferase [Lysobacter sp. CFH 32150]
MECGDYGRVIETLHALISELEHDHLLLEPNRLRQRIEALDRLENYLAFVPGADLHDRMKTLCADLEAANQRLYQSIRQEIQRGMGAERMLEWAPAVGSNGHAGQQVDGESYDYLDTLLSGVLQLDEPAPGIAELAAEMVFYQPTPARHIFELIGSAKIAERDVLIDLGSGLGHVPLLAAICTGARCIGIEWEAAYVDCAQRCANALNLANVTFVRQDAREADLSMGTMFYLYTPFTGAMLRDVLTRLRQEAVTREIRICTLGPCTPIIAREPWLEYVNVASIDQPALFRSV